MAISNAIRSITVALFLFVLVLSPIVPTSDAARFTEVLAKRPICPACLCCEPPPPGSCCSRCCASTSPSAVQSENGSP